MFAEEWSLMMFTLLAQLAVGIYILLIVARAALEKNENDKLPRNIISTGFLAVSGFMGLALLLSLFHLGTPGGAYRAILNLGSSWLSREILFAGLFFFLAVASYLLSRKESFNSAFGWFTSLIGILVVFSMANIYASSIRPAWETTYTVLSFFGTTLLFGTLGTVILILNGYKEKDTSPNVVTVLKKICVIGLIAIVFQFVYLPVYYAALPKAGAAGIESARIIAESYSMLMILRWMISIIGSGLLAFILFKQRDQSLAIPANIAYLAFVLVLVGEFMGRYLFYASGISIMIGMG